VHGLPLQLSPEEVTLCLARGWADVYSVDTAAARAAPFPKPPAVCTKEKEKKPLPAKGWGARPALPHEKKRQKTKSDRENAEPWTAVLRTPNKRVDTPYVHERDGESSTAEIKRRSGRFRERIPNAGGARCSRTCTRGA
jgi:hypothetical protein